MTPNEILQHFISLSNWIDPANTVDRIIIGDPEKDFDSCLVTWMPSQLALQAAIDNNINLIIAHEPTFWNHHDETPPNNKYIQQKIRFIHENDLVIIRNHDCWDRYPKIGITWAWADFLGFTDQPVAVSDNIFQHRYDIPPTPFKDFTQMIAGRCKTLGEPILQYTGDPNQSVSKIGIGTGCGTSVETFLDLGCDCSIVSDDGTTSWSDIQMAADLNHSIIRVNHGTSEVPGMITLTQYINDNLPLTATHHPCKTLFNLTIQ